MITLETSRLRLRPIQPSDFGSLLEMFSDPQVMRYLPGGLPLNEDAVRHKLENMTGHWQEHGFGSWAVEMKTDGTFIGYVLLQYLHNEPGGVEPGDLPDPNEAEIGYCFAARCWGQGYATEAARPVVWFAFKALGLPRLVAAIHPDNQASRRVLEKLGMAPALDYHFYGDCPHFNLQAEDFTLRTGDEA